MHEPTQPLTRHIGTVDFADGVIVHAHVGAGALRLQWQQTRPMFDGCPVLDIIDEWDEVLFSQRDVGHRVLEFACCPRMQALIEDAWSEVGIVYASIGADEFDVVLMPGASA
jgi:hypothetical protein